MRSDPTFWILARASGLTAYALIAVSVLAGLVLKARPFGTRVRPATVTDVHRFLALLALGAVAVHGIALVFDTTVKVDPLGLLVPGRIHYRPIWTGAGIVGAELALLIYVSFSLRKIIRVKNWRRLHWFTYAVFVAITAHGLLGGSDSGTAWARYFYLSTIGSVCFAVAWRTLTRPPARRRAAAPATPRGAIADT